MFFLLRIPENHLKIDINKRWESEMNTLKTQWNNLIASAKWKQKVQTYGESKCGKCGNNHTTNVGHKKCGNNALWYWVDYPSKYAICNGGCGEMQTITGVCCWSCGASLDIGIKSP